MSTRSRRNAAGGRSALVIVAANSRQYGNGARIAPDAVLDDGSLDLVVVGGRSAWRTLQHLPLLFRGRLGEAPDVWIERTTHARVFADAPLLAHADGEPLPCGGSVEIRVHAQALAVRAPRVYHRRDDSVTTP